MTKPIIALLYDFDKTLCTTDMEDYAFIPALGYTPAEFWHKANTFGRENRMDGLLAYMYTMIAECRAQGKTLKRDFLVECGRSMELFPGVREWFRRINAFGESQGVTIEHYVLSSGLKEIIEGSGIAHEFKHPYVKHTTKIFSLRLMDFQAQAYPDARRKTRGACQLLRVGQSRSPVRPLCNRKRFS